MLSLQTIETVVAVGAVLCFLGCDVVAWWMLVSGEVEEYRKAYRAVMVRKWCCGEEEEVKGGNPDRVVSG